jgi:signal transduction histidine kinase
LTLRLRLALLIAAAIAGALLLQGGFSYLSFRQALYRSLDHDLGAYLGQTLSELQRQQPPGQGQAPPPASSNLTPGIPPPPQASPAPPAQTPAPPIDPLGSARLIDHGAVIRTWAQFPGSIPLPDANTARIDLAVSIGPWRVRGERLPGGQYLQAAVSEQTLLASLSSYRQSTLLTALLVSLFGALLAWWLTGPALQPLRSLTRTARQIARSGDLRLRVQASTGGELGDLSQTFNDMLERLTEFLSRETQFARNASHELRTPLTALKLQLSAYRQGLTTPTETLDVVAEEVERMTRLTEALLVLAREERAVNVRVDLAQLASEMALKVGAGYSGPGHLHLLADPTLLRQALGNLLDNAAKYAPQSKVAVSLAAQTFIGAPYAVLSVLDGGPGLSAEALTRATQPFYRAPGMRVAGSGLGLSVVEQIARVHGGRLDLQNRTPQGLEARLWLPLELAEQELGADEVGSSGTAVPEPESAAG